MDGDKEGLAPPETIPAAPVPPSELAKSLVAVGMAVDELNEVPSYSSVVVIGLVVAVSPPVTNPGEDDEGIAPLFPLLPSPLKALPVVQFVPL
jgi:hypothetical protein